MPALRNLLEGKPLRTPLHPAVVHLPIALFPFSLLLDLGSRVCPANELYFVRGAYLALLAGLGTALVAAVLGWADYTDIRADHPARKTATLHLVLNLVAVALFAASGWWRHDELDSMATGWGPIALSLAGVLVLGYSGYLGGHLVYADGIGVGRHRRATRTPAATIHVPVSASGAGRVAIARADALRHGETLRLEVNGVVIAVARFGSRYHAFQEFCTHRYGPLSEGKLAGDCEVTCPWHGSRFDVRTGRALSGPATVDLRIFPVEIRDGQLWIEPPRRG
jgi:nitrite reductase/ring-hydroxylating ferredoxin subunit/uncharacterized membrane protein